MKIATLGFRTYKIGMANFEAFCLVISSGINLLFLKNDLPNQSLCIKWIDIDYKIWFKKPANGFAQ